ncbi:MAG TPA: helix-turn-helix transcriptional regulator [Jatrophihabitantaceae bacterium]|jgi:DNA-binding PadR family transcriptional regulator
MKSDALRGHLDSMILAVLEAEPLHGYLVMETLQRRSGGALGFSTGTIYPALRRLERSGYVRGEWATVGGRKRRTYRLTAAGKRALAAERAAWVDFTSVVGGVLQPE